MSVLNARYLSMYIDISSKIQLWWFIVSKDCNSTLRETKLLRLSDRWSTWNWLRSKLVTRSLSGGTGYSLSPSLRWGTHPFSETAHFVNSSTAGDAYKSPHLICRQSRMMSSTLSSEAIVGACFWHWRQKVLMCSKEEGNMLQALCWLNSYFGIWHLLPQDSPSMEI